VKKVPVIADGAAPAARFTVAKQGGTAMDEQDRLRFELGVLLASGRELGTYVKSEDLDPREVNERYQVWYSQTLRLVEGVLAERRCEFEGYYRTDHESRDQPATISAILGSLSGPRASAEKREALAGLFDPGLERATFLRLLGMQLAILASAVPLLLPEERRPDPELQAARRLLSKGHRRAAGVVAGLVLKRHLTKVAQRHDLALPKSGLPSLRRLNRALRRAGVCSPARSRQIKRLAKLSDSCVRGKGRISVKVVTELLSGVEDTLLHVC
jgi:hypothetical protein